MSAIPLEIGKTSNRGLAPFSALRKVIPTQGFFRDPRLVLAVLWPLILLAPHVPGIPRPSLSGLPWRQELALSLLLALTLGLLVKRGGTEALIRIERHRLLVLCGLGLFAIWTWLSITWATFAYPAFHLALQWTGYLVFFLLITSAAAHPRMMRSSFVALAVVVWVLAIACAIESWFGAPVTDGRFRDALKPILRGSGAFGEIMAMAAILFAGLTLHVRRSSRAMLCGVTAILAWLATLQSLERAPFIGALAGLLLLITGSAFGSLGNWRRLLRLFLLIAALVSVLSWESITPHHSANASSTVARLQTGMGADSNARVRLLFWGVGLEMVRAHPVLGVGGNNYEVSYPAARVQFSERHPASALVAMNEHLLTIYAHNEYLQILAELGIIGFFLFLLLCLAMVASLVRALKNKRQTVPALGAGGAMLAFAISSGASGSSFRYCSGALLFFFAAAIVTRLAANTEGSSAHKASERFQLNRISRNVAVPAFALMFLAVCILSVQASGIILHGLAQTSVESSKAENYYQASLRVFPSSTATNFGYGLWLYRQRRAAEAIPYLRFAVDRGFNSSPSYAYLAGAETCAGDLAAAERTLATAVQAYPKSVFLLVRHAVALERNGRSTEAEVTFARALSLDRRAARGWRGLIDNDIDAAYLASQQDRTIAPPGELLPEEAIFAVLHENEQRFPDRASTGWRGRMRAMQLR